MDGISTGLLKIAIKYRSKGDETIIYLLLTTAQAIYDAEGKHEITQDIV